MKQANRLLMSAVVLTMALGVSLPSAAGAKSEGRGREGRGQSSEARGGRSGNHEVSRGGGSHSSGERGYAQRGGNRGEDRRGSDSRGEARYREPRSDRGAGERYRDPRSDHRADVRSRFAQQVQDRRAAFDLLARATQTDVIDVGTDGDHLDELVRFFHARAARKRRRR